MNTNDDNKLPPEIEAELRQFLKDNPDPVYLDPMLPPWEVIPNEPMTSLAWRMGSGEEYRIIFGDWFFSLSEDKRKEFVAKNPEPNGWRGYYDLIIQRRLNKNTGR